MESNRIEVGMGKGIVARAPQIINSTGFGSCVAVAFYEAVQRAGGLAHIALPESTNSHEIYSPYQFADTAVTSLLEGMLKMGANRQRITAKMAGGARMFSTYGDNIKGVGDQIVDKIRQALESYRIPLKGSDVGGRHGRSVEFHLDSGELIVKVIGREDERI